MQSLLENNRGDFIDVENPLLQEETAQIAPAEFYAAVQKRI